MTNKVDKDKKINGLLFANFILSFLKDNYNVIDNDIIYDCFLPDGMGDFLPGKKDVYVEIKCSDNRNVINFNLQGQKVNTYVCYIGLFDEQYIGEKHAILGIEFIKRIFKTDKVNSFYYLAEYDPNLEIVAISNDRIIVKGNVYGFPEPIELIFDDLDCLSISNEKRYKDQIKKMRPGIIIGNGVSIPFGVQNWTTLSSNLFDYLTPLYVDDLNAVRKSIGDSNYFTTSMAKTFIPKAKYYDVIRHGLYGKYEPKKMHTSDTLLHSLVEVKNKNKDMPILTYNYDSLFEEDWEKTYGSKLDSISSKHSFITYSNSIVHIHGFFPFSGRKTNLVLTDEEYYNAYKGKGFAVSQQKTILSDYCCLYVGSSMSDLFQLQLISNVRNKINFSKNNSRETWYCYALMCFKGLSNKDKLTICKYYMYKGIRVIFTDDYNKLSTKVKELFGL